MIITRNIFYSNIDTVIGTVGKYDYYPAVDSDLSENANAKESYKISSAFCTVRDRIYGLIAKDSDKAEPF